jgi:hypothetical protein
MPCSSGLQRGAWQAYPSPARLPLLVRDQVFPSPRVFDSVRNAVRVMVVRGGKGRRDGRVMLPAMAAAPLVSHLEVVRRQYAEEVRRDAGSAELPGALGGEYQGAGRSWAWQRALPATRGYQDRGTRQRRGLRAAEPP